MEAGNSVRFYRRDIRSKPGSMNLTYQGVDLSICHTINGLEVLIDRLVGFGIGFAHWWGHLWKELI